MPCIARLCLGCLLASSTAALQFNLEANKEKCFNEDIEEHELFVAGFQSIDGASVSFKITGPEGKAIYTKDKAHSAKFTHTAHTEGWHKFCFNHRSSQTSRIDFTLKIGFAAKDYSRIAKKEHLKPLEIDLRKMEDELKEIHEEMQYMKKREFEMRDLNESTNGYILYFSLFSIFILTTMAMGQIIYLKRFFKSKQLIKD